MSKQYRIVPKPSSLEYGEKTFKFKKISLQGEGFEERYMTRALFPHEDYVRPDDADEDTLKVVKLKGSELPDEGYRIRVNEDGVTITYGERGLLYAYVTLAQILDQADGEVRELLLTDKPSCRYRGLMLDTARYFIPADEVRRFADLCVLHKLNAIHLHLTDDQGWRLESDAFPKLHHKGSKRSHTNFDRKKHEGYYRKSEMRSILRYCAERNIRVMPEIDMPGHMRAALACYPELGCFDRELEVATHSGVKHDILCAGKSGTYDFVFRVLDEVAELFAGYTDYIHIGGDEAPKMRWEICPACRKRMLKEGLKDAEQLQGYFMKQVAEHVVELGFAPVVWNEACMKGVMPKQTVWQYWHVEQGISEEETVRDAEQCGGMINSDSSYAYVDLPYGTISLAKSYEFAPKLPGLSQAKALGGEIELWGEYTPDQKTRMKRCLPRACALAERMWSGTDGGFGGFEDRLDEFEDFLEDRGFEGEDDRHVYQPDAVRGALQKLWFERRQLHWEGLHNLIDDAKVKRKFGKDPDKTSG